VHTQSRQCKSLPLACRIKNVLGAEIFRLSKELPVLCRVSRYGSLFKMRSRVLNRRWDAPARGAIIVTRRFPAGRRRLS
jgi:hypothetical protein